MGFNDGFGQGRFGPSQRKKHTFTIQPKLQVNNKPKALHASYICIDSIHSDARILYIIYLYTHKHF